MELQRAKAVVTGGASGLGRATALHLARAGARVAILDLDGAAAQALARELGDGELGGRVWAFAADVAAESSLEAAVAGAVAALGGLTLAVHCAGILGGAGSACPWRRSSVAWPSTSPAPSCPVARRWRPCGKTPPGRTASAG